MPGSPVSGGSVATVWAERMRAGTFG